MYSTQSGADTNNTRTSSRRFHQWDHSSNHVLGAIIICFNNLPGMFNRIIISNVEINSCIIYLENIKKFALILTTICFDIEKENKIGGIR